MIPGSLRKTCLDSKAGKEAYLAFDKIYIHFKETEKAFPNYKFSKVNALRKGSEVRWRKSLLFSTERVKLLILNFYLPLQNTGPPAEPVGK